MQKLYELAEPFDSLIGQYLFPNAAKGKSTCRRQLGTMLDSMDERDLAVVSATAKAIQEAKSVKKTSYEQLNLE